MSHRVQGINAVTMSNVLNALHGPILGPETAYAAITFESSNPDDSTAIYHEFVQHAGAIRFADSAYTVATCLQQRNQEDIDLLVATVPLAVATERMHDTIRELAVNSYQRICSVETDAVLPLESNILSLRTATGTKKRRAAWRSLRSTVKNNHIIPFLEETHRFLHLAGDLSQKRRVIFGARPDTGPKTKHFQLVREFLHNISNGLLPFTTELQLLKEELSKLPARMPEEELFNETIENLTSRLDKWYKAYGSGILTLHRYFIFDGLEKANRLAVMPSIEILALAAATSSPIPLERAKLDLQASNIHQNYAAPLRKQRDELRTLLENISVWHSEFNKQSPSASCASSQVELLIESTQRAIIALSKLARHVPRSNKTATSKPRTHAFYVSLGEFRTIAINMAQKFEGWDSRREAHMKLPY